MKTLSNYDKYPFTQIHGMSDQAWEGYDSILDEIYRKIKAIGKKRIIIAVDCYHGVRETEIEKAFKKLNLKKTYHTSTSNYSNDKIFSMLERFITDDRVFGLLSHHEISEFFNPLKIDKIRDEVDNVNGGIILIIGVGASLLYKADILIYADMARWEIQQRMRTLEIGNWCADNKDEDFLRKYKRAYFIDWRVLDRHKKSLFEKFDYLLDTNISNKSKMITGEAFREGLRQVVKRPFRVVPLFDPAPWGGKWMQKVCDLDKNIDNFGWCFDCIPEENSLYLKYGNISVEIPSLNLVLYQPESLLGEKVFARFGAEFPIRFDFLDTMGGGNLSLQVHPLTGYIQEKFGMHYTQDESYYILDAENDATVYLGLKNCIEPDKMIAELKKAEKGEMTFDAEKYVNKWPAKKHDHFLIPAGTVHCSGKNSMVLEISSTPYIFTFKLWDWGRLGLDGLPRPVHINHGKNVIRWGRKSNWITQSCINQIKIIDKGDGFVQEKTGLHDLEFIETRRHWFTKKVHHNTMGIVNVLNLIEGRQALVESPSNAFEPFLVHYAETFIIPANVGEYTIAPHGESEGKKLGTIKAYIRT